MNSFLGFNSLISAWLFALLAPLVLFYFLKLKRPRADVPSLVLWRQVLRDNRVNSPFQKFKRNLLLLLQIVLLSLLALAAMQPFWRGRRGKIASLPMLIDCSASMAALDKAGGKSRLDLAKDMARKRIDDMLPGQEMCILSFSDSARKLTDFTDNKRLLRAALDKIVVDDVRSNIEDALRMTQALALGVSFDDVLLLTDGNFPMETDIELAFQLDYQRLPAGGPNMGITSLSARRAKGGNWDVFVRIEAGKDVHGAGKVEILSGDEPAGDPMDVMFTGGGDERMVFSLPGDSRVKAVLTPDGFDALATDNVAFLDLPPARPLWVYVAGSGPMACFRHALRDDPDVRLFTDAEGEGVPPSPGDSYDLAITDRPDEMALESRAALYVRMTPDDLKDLLTIEEGSGDIVDWDRASPMLQYVELSGLAMLDEPTSAQHVRDGDYESRGYEIVAHGESGPMLLQRRKDDRLLYYLLFHPDRSTLPYRVGFPVLVANAARIAMFHTGLAEVRGARTGVLPPLQLAPETAYSVTGPGGKSWEATTDRNGTLSGVPARRAGRYAVAGPGGSGTQVGAALLHPAETSLASVDEILFKEGLSVEAAAQPPRSDKSLWRTLGLLAFGVLLAEWWYFQRRP